MQTIIYFRILISIARVSDFQTYNWIWRSFRFDKPDLKSLQNEYLFSSRRLLCSSIDLMLNLMLNLNHLSFIIRSYAHGIIPTFWLWRDLVEEMVVWQRERYLDAGIWDHLHGKINPALMPASSVLEKRILPQLQYTVNKIICSCDMLNPVFY